MADSRRARHLGPAVRRPLILDAALPLFANDGYDAVSMQAIADAAEVSKPVLYSCFESKEELFDALARRENRRLWELVDSLTPATPGGGDGDAALLEQALTGLFRAVEQAPDAIRVLYVEARGENRIVRGRRHWHERMATHLREHAAGLDEREADVLGRLLVATAELGFSVLLDPEPEWGAAELAAFLAPRLVRDLPAAVA
ncbi:MAG: helix-turn-helix domain-containing protein [Baekduia sp.]